jgi:type IV pilus assembly protein PilA
MQPPPPGQPYPVAQQATPPPKKGMSTCLIVVLASVAVAILVVTILGAIAYSSFKRYIATSKTLEAKNAISQIARDAVAAYARETTAGEHRLCGSAVRVPAAVPKGIKYKPSSGDFDTGDANNGWLCLKFTMSEPFYYQYAYEKGRGSGKSGAPATGFEASARGDLNGDGVTSFFARTGDVKNGSVVLNPDLYIENELE